jgi:hypothetical protein
MIIGLTIGKVESPTDGRYRKEHKKGLQKDNLSYDGSPSMKRVADMSMHTNSVALVMSELYRSSDRRLSAKLVPNFADRGVSHGQCGGSPTAVI